MKVLKFGGTSVGTPERMKNVVRLISNNVPKIVVLSATSGTTNALEEISAGLYNNEIDKAQDLIDKLQSKFISFAKELLTLEDFRQRAFDYVTGKCQSIYKYTKGTFTAVEEKEILSIGELISSNLMSMCLSEQGIRNAILPALDFMRTGLDSDPDSDYIEEKLCFALDLHKDTDLFITQGYICRNAYGEVDNLQRGGSDYTASLIGAAIEAEEIQIWTDIDGMHNNDPRIVEHTRPVRELNFEEAEKLAYFGAKILHPSCILPAKRKNIPVRLLSSMEPDAPGTLISNKVAGKGSIKAVAAKDGITYIKIKAVQTLRSHLFLSKVFDTFAAYKTSIDMVTTSDRGISLTIDNTQLLPYILKELEKYASVTIEDNMVIVCVVGNMEWQNVGFEANIIGALKDIPIRMISYGGSNSNVSLVMKADDKRKALQSLSSTLFA